MKSYTGYTPNGVEVSCKIDPEKSEAIVEYEEYLRFFFNPDFPQDAKAFFEALRNVRGIVIEDNIFNQNQNIKPAANTQA